MTSFLRLFATTLTFLPLALASGVFFPLYIYPGSGCSGWQSIINVANSHTSTPFYIVINPASGPGSSNSQPDTNYQACIPKLKATANKNVKVIGYVSTSYGNRAEADVNRDVTTYKGWGTAYRPNGIFYDEAPTASGLVSLYARYASNARTQLGGTVVFNPGTVPDSAYFNSADLVVTAEYEQSRFSVSSLPTSSSTPTKKQVVILHTGPSTTNANLVNSLKSAGVEGIFLTERPSADAYSYLPADWSRFVDLVAA